MSRSLGVLIVSVLLLTGCAYRMKTEPPSAEHPGSPNAPEAPRTAPSPSLHPDDQDGVRTAAPGEEEAKP